MSQFTSLNAHEMAARSVEARRQRRLERYERAASSLETPQDADYVSVRLVRVRAHIEQTDEALEKAREPLDRERLSRSLAQLQETERVLAGRPAPGAYRPRQTKQVESAVVEPV